MGVFGSHSLGLASYSDDVFSCRASLRVVRLDGSLVSNPFVVPSTVDYSPRS